MSYCHLTGGLARIDLTFGSVVTDRIGLGVQSATCLATAEPTCGNGVIESGEQCDDGNRTGGDCCSPACATEPCTPTTTTSSTSTSTSHPATTSSTLPRPSTTTTTSTTIAPAGDGDGDGVRDGADACLATTLGELVDATGCPVCPCEAMRDGSPWASRSAYLKCLRGELRRRARLGETSRADARAITRQTRLSTCGSSDLTRCCVYPKTGDVPGDCRVLRAGRCDARRPRALRVADVGPGICAADTCAP